MTNTAVILRTVTCILLVGSCLYHSLGMARIVRRDFVNSANPDSVTLFEKRLEPLEIQLSGLKCREVGYITDAPEVADWFTEYFRTQFVLAPVIVENSTNYPLVVANLHDSSMIYQIVRQRNLIVIQNYNNGVFLLSREAR